MRSLFLKIFLWFWLAMVLATLTLSISSSISQSRSSRDREERMDRTMTPLVADNFAEVFSREGVNGFVAFLERGKEVFPWVVYLFDESGVELTSRPFPAPVKQGFE